jgi:predicted transcriptional regulator
MTSDEVIQKVKAVPNRRELARQTGLPYDYLCRLAGGRIQDPGSSKIDLLREHFQRAP